ncbi:MAG TPA: mobile mystery protein B [Bradyrhizobium sp.]|uniref:mobile mystery protein B n=1 Tax=Bradyrhizobium sp. TaxID=376 RepID=UPI002C7E85F3|nr:mobile mystery protein B [Bradyrhizobium sp.]HLZ06645.1 mobile mystery protein B [Bradyrhizobium sp.]
MTDLFQEPDDATPLDPALRGDLIQTWITTRADLNEAEEENIASGAAWARRRRGGTDALLNENFSKSLHKQMFGDVWKWAGTYRQTELNIGIAPHLIAAEMPVMFDNVRFWVANKTYSADEIAVRLHHRLTQIHGFPNGNGRHARMMADLLIEKLGGEPFTWGSGSIHDTGTLRTTYINALRAADNHDFGPLLAFARA